MTDSERLRLFVAARVPESHLRVVDDATARLKRALPAARWTPVDNQHITVKFLGSTPADRLPGVRDVLGSVAAAHSPGDLRLSSLGAFPSVRRARVLWAGLDDPRDVLRNVARDLDDGFEPLGYVPEKRAFTPHLTLARFKVPRPLPPELPELPAARLPPFSVRDIVLFRSRLSPKGARYEAVESFSLGPGP